jgi:hypothetical protein
VDDLIGIGTDYRLRNLKSTYWAECGLRA